MHRFSKATSALDGCGGGVISFHLDRAALCCEASCEVIFDMAAGRDSQSVLCPGCGGASWVPLSTIVPSLRLAPAPPRMTVVPMAARLRA
jgi:hypothetical protein